MTFEKCGDCKSPIGCGIRKECAMQQPPAVKPAAAVVKEPENAPAPQETTQANPGVKLEAPRATPDAVVEGQASGAPSPAEAFIATRRLCKECKHFSKPLGRPTHSGNCKHPDLPINLVDGGRIFPCIIARGYAQLCGPLGLRWSYDG